MARSQTYGDQRAFRVRQGIFPWKTTNFGDAYWDKKRWEATVPWRVLPTTPEGCRNWAPYARWMEIAQNRTLWRMFTWNTLLNEEYWNQIKGRLPAK